MRNQHFIVDLRQPLSVIIPSRLTFSKVLFARSPWIEEHQQQPFSVFSLYYDTFWYAFLAMCISYSASFHNYLSSWSSISLRTPHIGTLSNNNSQKTRLPGFDVIFLNTVLLVEGRATFHCRSLVDVLWVVTCGSFEIKGNVMDSRCAACAPSLNLPFGTGHADVIDVMSICGLKCAICHWC